MVIGRINLDGRGFDFALCAHLTGAYLLAASSARWTYLIGENCLCNEQIIFTAYLNWVLLFSSGRSKFNQSRHTRWPLEIRISYGILTTH